MSQRNIQSKNVSSSPRLCISSVSCVYRAVFCACRSMWPKCYQPKCFSRRTRQYDFNSVEKPFQILNRFESNQSCNQNQSFNFENQVSAVLFWFKNENVREQVLEWMQLWFISQLHRRHHTDSMKMFKQTMKMSTLMMFLAEFLTLSRRFRRLQAEQWSHCIVGHAHSTK